MALTLVAIVGFTNAFNFMDGIDGLAATVAALGGLFIGAMQMPASALVAVATTGATIGFLVHNLPPARIFLGDVGSQYLGFLLAALAVAGERVAGIPASLIALVFLPFAVDTTVTLVRRLRRGERWHQPHQDHIYQRLVADGWSHAQTTALYAVLTAVSGVVLLMVTQWPRLGWIWSLSALSTIAVVLTPPRMWRRVMLRR
jgi:UDP-N-acetylmuramyl pentapeptide phosphotransferase/UDP-N-acetylglucosamine-1-phosphate transferase